MRTRFGLHIAALVIVAMTAHDITGEQEKTTKKGSGVKVPPLSDGGVASLWANEHEFVKHKYGPFELLNFGNTAYRIKRDTVTDKTWQLVAMGNFLPEGLQFATLARLKNKPDGTLLIVFEWNEAKDSSRTHGVFYHSYLSKPDLLIRTKQGAGGAFDTLQISCADIQRVCGKCYYDSSASRIQLKMVDK